jgi:hypothetical protein
LWAFVPLLILSFSSIKETSYIISSYSAVALLASSWLDKHLSAESRQIYPGLGWFVIVIPAAGISFFLFGLDALNYIFISIGVLALSVALIWYIVRKRFINTFFFAVLSVAAYLIIIFNSPNVLFAKGYCDLSFARQVWGNVGDKTLYLYKPRDYIRGTLPFAQNRLTSELDRIEELNYVLQTENKASILIENRMLEIVRNDPAWSHPRIKCRLLSDNNKREFALLERDNR